MQLSVRPFEDSDYDRLAEMGTALDPSYAFTPAMLRYRDATMEPRVRLLRLSAEVDGTVVGFGRIMHLWWNYHPRRYQMRIEVHPSLQRRGIGSTLFERLLDELHAWDAELVRAEAHATRAEAVLFLEHRGFREWRSRWESVLQVAAADTSSLLDADERLAGHGVSLITYDAEFDRRGDRLRRELYDMEALIFRDEPAMLDSSESMSFARFCATELDTPDALPEAHFLALHGQELVGVSRLLRDLKHGDVLRQAFTGVHPAFRGRGIAQALKLRTVEFARAGGYREIHTSNDSTNGPMLHINDAIGFRRDTPIVIYERHL